MVSGSGEHGSEAHYSFYSLDDPHRSVDFWLLVNGEAQIEILVQRIVASLEWGPPKLASQYVEEGRQALAEGRSHDAQFALAQAYLLGEQNPGVVLKLALLSAELDNRRLAELLTQELMRSDPENADASTLYQRVRRVLAVTSPTVSSPTSEFSGS